MKGIKHLFFFAALLGCVRNTFASELPVETFSRLPAYESPTLSPDGSKIAFIENEENPDKAVLVYFDFSSGERKQLVQTDNLEKKIK